MIHAMEELGELARIVTHLESRRAEVQTIRNEAVLQQAELMIEARKTFDNNPRGLEISDEIYNRRFEIAKLIRSHNQKVLPPCCPS